MLFRSTCPTTNLESEKALIAFPPSFCTICIPCSKASYSASLGIHQNGVARRADDKSLIRDEHLPRVGVEHFWLHHLQMLLEGGLIVGRKEILRPSPWPFAFNHSVNGDVADSDLPRCRFLLGVTGIA